MTACPDKQATKKQPARGLATVVPITEQTKTEPYDSLDNYLQHLSANYVIDFTQIIYWTKATNSA